MKSSRIVRRITKPRILIFLFIFCLWLSFIIGLSFFDKIEELCHLDSQDFSCGEKSDFFYQSTDETPEEQKGRKSFANGNYQDAVTELTTAWEKTKEPDILVALNNATVIRDIRNGRIHRNNVFAIALAISFNYIPDLMFKNLLAGVAQKQSEVNTARTGTWELIVLIANDNNQSDQALKIASELGNKNHILGVVGSYSSHISANVIDNYGISKLSFISPSASASKDNFKPSKDTPFFFRPVSTTKVAASHLVKYLKQHGYSQVILFYQDDGLFGKSYYLDLKPILQENDIDIIYKEQYIQTPEYELRNAIKKLRERYNKEKETTALVILPDASNTRDENDKKLAIIEANQGDFFIAGSTRLSDDDVLQLANKIGKDAIENMVVTVPWFPTEENMNKYQAFWGKDAELTWHSLLSYDATQMLVQAISQQIKQENNPTRQGVRDILADGNFETEGYTGKITLNGSDRQEQINSLIYPDCSTNPCKWRLIENHP